LLMDAAYAFPSLLLAIVVAFALRRYVGQGVPAAALAISVIYVPQYFRVVRNHTLAVREETFVEAARAMGAARATIIRKYVLFNVVQSVPVIFTVNAADAILTLAGLGFLGYGDAGLVVLDAADLTRPRLLARLDWRPGGGTHTCLPLPARRLVVVTDEQLRDGPGAEPRLVRVVDVSDPASPRVAGVCPEPEGDFAERPLRFGPHNLHENRAGSYRSARVVFVTYFNAGLRVYDLVDPARPVELASWVPETPAGQEAPQTNDLFVEANGRVWATDRIGGGLHCLEPEPELAELIRARSL